jgi:hypothetical protein
VGPLGMLGWQASSSCKPAAGRQAEMAGLVCWQAGGAGRMTGLALDQGW